MEFRAWSKFRPILQESRFGLVQPRRSKRARSFPWQERPRSTANEVEQIFLPRVDDHFRNVLGIRHVERREGAHFGERIETGTAAFFNRRELEANVTRVPLKPAVFAQFSPLMS